MNHKQKSNNRSFANQVKRNSRKAFHSPGEGRYVGESPDSDFNAQLLTYNENHFQEINFGPNTPLPPLSSSTIHWLQIKGLSAIVPIEQICHSLQLHPLSIEDIFNTYHSAKFEEFPEYALLINKYFHFNPSTQSLEPHRIAIVLKGNLLVTFQDTDTDLFTTIISRLSKGHGRMRKMPIDYLFYRLTDFLLDQNFLTMDAIWEAADVLDKAIMDKPDKQLASEIQHLKREMIHFLKSFRPIRQSINAIIQSTSPLFHNEIRLFFRDLQDHVNEISDISETLSHYLIESYNLYMSVLSQKANDVMKILTVIATIFIPLTFIVGVYGMNFKFMPELNHPLAYPILWLIMIAIALTMVFYFKRKKWF